MNIKKIIKGMYLIIAILQTILHYLGIAGIILGIVAYLFGNRSRSTELLIGGIAFIVLKYGIGIIYLIVAWVILFLLSSCKRIGYARIDFKVPFW